MKPIIVVAAFSLLPLCCCGSYLHSLQARAAFEMDCPKESLSIEPLGQWSVEGVRGCGKKAVYVYIGGQWLLNSDGQHEVVQAAIIEEQRREEEERRKKEEEERAEEREQEEYEKRRRERMDDTW